jgi:copper(I)-binding protein
VKAQLAMRRRFGIGFVAVLAALLTASCAAGQNAQTSEVTAAVDGSAAKVGSIELHEVAVVAPNGNSYAKGASAQVALVIVNTGSTDDTLVGVSSPTATSSALYANSAAADAATSSATAAASNTASPGASSGSSASSSAPSPGVTSSGSTAGSTSASAPPSTSPAPSSLSSLAIPAGERASLGINGTDPVLLLVGLTQPLYGANQVTMTFDFRSAGPVTFTVPVQLTDISTLTPLVIPPVATSS